MQIRPVQDSKPFEMIKFRTTLDLQHRQYTLPADDKRITKLAHFIRSTWLDELPELCNVLKREMSLDGHRIPSVEYLSLYTADQASRDENRTRLTEWTQIHGRNRVSRVEKFSLDTWYVENQRFHLELKIICLTIWKVLTRDGIFAEG